MKTMKIMSIIGIAWCGLSLICVLGFIDADIEASAGWGMLGLLYAVPYSITGLVLTLKNEKNNTSGSINDLLELNELKEKGILTESEFQTHKDRLIK